MCNIAEFGFGENKKPPTEPFQNKRIRNPATARTVPSRMVCAPSFLSLRRRGMRLTASGGRSASPHPESRLLFTLCGFLRSFLSRTSVGGLAFGFTIFFGKRGERGDWGTGERSLLKKLRKTFIWGMGWVEFVQVRLRTNFAPSKSAGDRSGAADEGHPPSTGRDCGI